MPEASDAAVSDYRGFGEKFPITVEWAYDSNPDPAKSVDVAEKNFIRTLLENYPHLSSKVVEAQDGFLEYQTSEMQAIGLGFREEFINALYHGNYDMHHTSALENMEQAQAKFKANPTLKHMQIVVRLTMSEKSIEVVIMDEGKGYDPDEVDDATHKDHILKPRGRGKLLSKAFGYDKISENTGNGTTATLQREFKEEI